MENNIFSTLIDGVKQIQDAVEQKDPKQAKELKNALKGFDEKMVELESKKDEFQKLQKEILKTWV